MAGTPASLALFGALQRFGRIVTLKRNTNDNNQPMTIPVLAKVNPIIPGPSQVPAQGRWRVILTDEEITERQWPAPIRRGDFINFDRRDHNVDSVHLHYEGGAVCRIELDVIG